MLMAIAGIEILVGVASQIAQTLNLVLYGMRVHDVHDHGDAQSVSFVDEGLQFLGCAEAAAGCEER